MEPTEVRVLQKSKNNKIICPYILYGNKQGVISKSENAIPNVLKNQERFPKSVSRNYSGYDNL